MSFKKTFGLNILLLNRPPEPHEQPPRPVLRAAAQREGGLGQPEDPQPVQDPGEVGAAERGHLGGTGQRPEAAARVEAEEQGPIWFVVVVSSSSW